MPIQLSIRGRYYPNKQILTDVAKTSVPNVLEKMALSFAYIVITPLVAKLGTVSIAANALAITVESMCYLLCFGFSIASTTLVAQTIGADMPRLTNQYIQISSFIAVAIMTAAGGLMFLFVKQLMGIFNHIVTHNDLRVYFIRKILCFIYCPKPYTSVPVNQSTGFFLLYCTYFYFMIIY